MPLFDEVCSAELFNQKQMVPCDPVKYLDFEYGPSNWLMPLVANYSWKNLYYKANWTDYEWPRVLKYYYNNGSINVKTSLRIINENLKNPLVELPLD